MRRILTPWLILLTAHCSELHVGGFNDPDLGSDSSAVDGTWNEAGPRESGPTDGGRAGDIADAADTSADAALDRVEAAVADTSADAALDLVEAEVVDPCAHDQGEISIDPDAADRPTPIGIALCGIPASLWFTQSTVNLQSMRITGSVRRIAGDALDVPFSPWTSGAGSPEEITQGPDGRCWYTDLAPDRIAVQSPYAVIAFQASGQPFESFTLSQRPNGLGTGPDDRVWVISDSNLWRLDPATHTGSSFSSESIQLPDNRLATGPDHRLWFTTDVGIGCLGCVGDAGGLIPFAPWGLGASRLPRGIAGARIENILWVTEFGAGAIGKLAVDGGLVRDYFLEPRDAGAEAGTSATRIAPNGIVVDAQNTVWFTEYGADRIGWITADGQLCQHDLALGSGPYDITEGTGDGRIWFTERLSHAIGWIKRR